MKIIMAGPLGSGKGTYAAKISERFGIPHISTGQIFRDNISAGTELGKKVLHFMNGCQMVPDDITMEIVKDRLSKPDCRNGYVFDGFPRNLYQAEQLEKISKTDILILLKLPDEIIIEKNLARRVCEKCGENYNLADIHKTVGGVRYNFPPLKPKVSGVCDKCGGKLATRDNDTDVEKIKERMKHVRAPDDMLEFYKKKGIVKEVYANDIPPVMAEKIVKLIKGD